MGFKILEKKRRTTQKMNQVETKARINLYPIKHRATSGTKMKWPLPMQQAKPIPLPLTEFIQ
jgi:hypothetical protein